MDLSNQRKTLILFECYFVRRSHRIKIGNVKYERKCMTLGVLHGTVGTIVLFPLLYIMELSNL